VADDDVPFRHEGGTRRGEDDDLAARESLAEVIVGVALEHEGHAARHERTEALAGRAREVEVDGVFRQSFRSVPAGNLAAYDRADPSIHVANRQARAHRRAALERRLAEIEKGGDIQRLVESVILFDLAEATDLRTHVRLVKNVTEVKTPGLPVVYGFPRH